MNITVLGAAGWLGRAILENLSVHHDVRAVDVGPEAWTTDSFVGEIVHGDITDFDTVDRTIEEADAVIHVAVYAYMPRQRCPTLPHQPEGTLEHAGVCQKKRPPSNCAYWFLSG